MPTDAEAKKRPNPDALLHAAREEERRHGGRLKIFLGAAPGVGKTFTMLEAARTKAMNKTDVAIGVVETHGRSETAELILGLDIVPRTRMEYQGRMLEEMDLDTILRRRPALVLVDELAHTNAPGSRHPKRYMDVEELLNAGIDVYTTLNIQHLESLNDAVAQITGIRVRETVPDRIMERADEVELVDVSVEDLLGRLHDGKVYLPDQAERAVRSYFRPGNLNALRQLALRHMAARVDEQMHTYMRAHAIPGPWPATERLLVSVGPSPLSPRLVRATRRRAERRHAAWIAVYVETPGHYRLGETDRDRVARTLKLAEELGGEVVTIPGADVGEELIRFARASNVTEIVVGKSRRSRWFELLHGSIVNDVVRKSGDIDVFVIAGADEEEGTPPPAPEPTARPHTLAAYAWGAGIVATAAIAGSLLRAHIALPNLSLIFLLGVLLAAVIWGLRVSIFVSLVSVLVYDFFFVPPHYTFSISSPQDVLALVTFLVAAVLTSNLAGRARDQGEAARRREARTAALFALSRDLAAANGIDNVVRAVAHQFAQSLAADVVVLLPEGETLEQYASQPPDRRLSEAERGAAVWSWKNNRSAGHGTDTLPGERWTYLPLRTSNGAIGVIALRPADLQLSADPDQGRLIEAFCDQAALAIERARFTHDIEQARLLNERERLQAILLSSISHDLRTPLASIIGSASSLLESADMFDATTRRELQSTILEEAERLNRFVGNLLDTMRLESGALRLNREPADVSDLLGAAIGRLKNRLADHPITFSAEPGLPMVNVDFVLFEQVLVNLLDNAAKYSPAGSPIRVRVRREGALVAIDVEDEGIGIAQDDLERFFDKFYRVQRGDRQMAGTGLGLSICRGIVEEHGGTITANSPATGGRGTIFSVRLPAVESPAAPAIDGATGAAR